ncbi:hypothetical protein ABPG74_004514 [Tetrahymena malaccensis]
MEETSLQSSIKQPAQRSLTVFPSLSSKVPNQIEKAQSSRSSGGSKSEDYCENCQKTKVCIQQKCVESQEMNFCCEKCQKKKHADHFKDFVIDISSIDSQIRKLHQEVIDTPLFRLTTDLKEMLKDFNDFKKLFPQIQEIPIVEFVLNYKRISQTNIKSQKEDYDRIRKESIKNAIRISKIEKKNSKLKLQIDQIEIEHNTMSLLKRYEDIIQQQQLKLDEFKERTNKIFQDIKRVIPNNSNVFYQSLQIGSKPVRYIEKDNSLFQKEKNNIQSLNNNYNSTQERDEDMLSYNNSTLNSFNSNNNNSFNNQLYSINNQFQLNHHGQQINSNSNLMMVSQIDQNNIFNNTQAIKKGVDNLENNQQFLYQNQCFSNSISGQRIDSNSNSKKFTSDIINYQPLLEKQLQEQYEQYTQQKLESINQHGTNSNHKPLSRNINNLFSESNQNNNSFCNSNSNIDQLRSTPYKQQKTQKKINEYFVSNKNPKAQVKQEDQNQIKQSLLQDQKFIQQQEQQLIFYQQQKEKQLQEQQKLQAQKQMQQFMQPIKQNTIQQDFLNQQNYQKKQQIQQQQQQQFKNQLVQQQQQQQQLEIQPIPVLKQESIGQKQEINLLQQNKKVDNVFMKNDAFLIDELMKLTQSTIYTQNDDDNDLRKSPSLQQTYTNSQLNSFPMSKSVGESFLRDKQCTNQIIIEESQELNVNKYKQPTVINSLDLLCQEQLSDNNEQSNSIQIEINASVQSKSKSRQTDNNHKSKIQKSNIISIPSTSSLSSVSKQEVNEAKVFYEQTFGAQPEQPKDDQQIVPSQDFYCWETLTDTQNKDKKQ